MKKLISVFAALALVGSLAAQKGKKPAKAPAKPAVAAPAVPAAVTTAAAIAPSAKGAAKGVGLFVEGRGTFTFGMGSSDSIASGDLSQTSVTYQLANTSGFGGGGSIGYEIMNGLGLVASFDYRSIKSREWSQTKNTKIGVGATASTIGGGITVDQKIQNKTDTMVIGVGFRPTIEALGGRFYAGMGFAYVLSSDSITDVTVSNPSSTAVTTTAQKLTNGRNAAMGVYGELGYNFSITDNLYLGIGARGLIATGNNDGKELKIETTSSTGTTTTTVAYKSTVDSSATNPSQSAYSSFGVTDFSAAVTLGFRF